MLLSSLLRLILNECARVSTVFWIFCARCSKSPQLSGQRVAVPQHERAAPDALLVGLGEASSCQSAMSSRQLVVSSPRADMSAGCVAMSSRLADRSVSFADMTLRRADMSLSGADLSASGVDMSSWPEDMSLSLLDVSAPAPPRAGAGVDRSGDAPAVI